MSTDVDWEAVNAIGTAVQATAVTLSLPIIIGQLRQSQRVHIEQTLERGNAAALETRARLRVLKAHTAQHLPLSVADLNNIRDLALRLEAYLATIQAEIRLRGLRRSAPTVEAYYNDLDEFLDIIGYAVDNLDEQVGKYAADVLKVVDRFLENLHASTDDAEALRAAVKAGDDEKFSKLLEAIAIKYASAQGASAEDIAKLKDDLLKSEVLDEDDDRRQRLFTEAGGDIANRRLARYWLSEVKALLASTKSLLQKLKQILGMNKAEKVKVATDADR